MESTSSEDFMNNQLISSVKQDPDNIDINNILLMITQKCKQEMDNNSLHTPLEDYMGRVAYYAGLSRSTIIKVLKHIDYKNKYFELSDLIDIFKFNADLYAKNETPSYKKIFAWYKNNHTISTLSQFQYMISFLRFEYHKTKLGQEILMEDPSLTFERFLYFKQLKNYRSQCAPIYYIDECFFDSTYTFSKPWIKDIDISSPACNGYVFFHAISTQGFLNGLFCSPTTKKDFVKWISHILIPQLPGPSVIVMDNNDLHGSLVDTITKYNSKDDMVQYLRQRNIPCNECLNKAELYELITKCSVQGSCYDVDEILRAHGHHVLRLPTNFHDLSLTHFLWKYFCNSPDAFYDFELSKIKNVLLEKLKHLPQEYWYSFHEALLTSEEDIFETDAKVYEALDTINLDYKNVQSIDS